MEKSETGVEERLLEAEDEDSSELSCRSAVSMPDSKAQVAGDPPHICSQSSKNIITTRPWPLRCPESTACLYFPQMAFSFEVTWGFVMESFLCRNSLPPAVSLDGYCWIKAAKISAYFDWHDSQSKFSWNFAAL